MSAHISLPNSYSYIKTRGRIFKTDWYTNTVVSLEYFDGKYLEINVNPTINTMSPTVNSPIFTSLEYRWLEYFHGDLIIKCPNFDIVSYYLGRDSFKSIGKDLYQGTIKYSYNATFGMCFRNVLLEDLTPELYLKRTLGDKIVLAQGETINKLDLLSTMNVDAGNFGRGYEKETWYGVIINMIRTRSVKTRESTKTVVALGSMDENFIYLYQDEETEDPTLLLPRVQFFGASFSGRKELELCLEPLKKWNQQYQLET